MSVDFADKFDIVITAINNQMITSNNKGNLHLLFIIILSQCFLKTNEKIKFFIF